MYEKEIETARAVAIEAGRIILDIRARGAKVDWKGERDPVTEADRAASRYLVATLEDVFPEDGVLSEEEADDAGRLGKARVWIVDPLDGTQEFVDGLDQYAVMVGLGVEGKAVLGVVYRPQAEQLLLAAPGLGAWEEMRSGRRKLQVTRAGSIPDARLVASRSHLSPLVAKVAEAMGLRNPPLRLGSVGLKVALLSAGEADLYVHMGPGIKEWDTCAPEAILTLAGGKVTDPFGEPLRYNQADVRRKEGVIASSGGALHDAAVKAATCVLQSR